MLERNRIYYINLSGIVYQCRIASLKVKLNELKFVDGSAHITTAFDSCCMELPNKYIDIGLYGENIIDFALYDSSDDAVLNNISNASFWYDSSINALDAKEYDDLLINKGCIFWADEEQCFFCEEQDGGFLNRLFGTKPYSILKSYKWQNGKVTSTNELAKDARYDVINRYIEYRNPFVGDFSNYANDISIAHKKEEIKAKNAKVVCFSDI